MLFNCISTRVRRSDKETIVIILINILVATCFSCFRREEILAWRGCLLARSQNGSSAVLGAYVEKDIKAIHYQSLHLDTRSWKLLLLHILCFAYYPYTD